MSFDFKIRTAQPQDARSITEVYYKTWLDTYPNAEFNITKEDIEYSYKDRFTDEAVKDHQKRIAECPPNEKRLVAELDNGRIVGVATIVRNTDNNQLRTIYVLPGYQGKGIGFALWNEAKKFADPSKDTIVQVATYNSKAIHFYKRLGFVDTGKRFTDDAFTMRNGAKLPEMEMIMKAIA